MLQIDIPGQSEQIHWLNFSPVEEHFYRRQYKECAKLSMQVKSINLIDIKVSLSALNHVRHKNTKLYRK